MGFQSGKFLFSSFLGMVMFLAISRSMQCIPHLNSLHIYSAAALGLFFDIGATISVILFLYSSVSLIYFSSYSRLESAPAFNFRTAMMVVLLCTVFTLFLLVYDAAIYYLLPMICGGY